MFISVLLKKLLPGSPDHRDMLIHHHQVLNFLSFQIAGAGLLYIGIEVFLTYNNVSQLTKAMYVLVPASIIIATGIFMFVLGLVGCIGGCKESKCLLALVRYEFDVLLEMCHLFENQDEPQFDVKSLVVFSST